jgi:hypothetical protein
VGVGRVGADRKRRPPWRVEGAPERVVERAQADLVACPQRAAGADQVCAGAALLVGDDRAQDPVDRGVESLDDWMVVVESTAVDLHHELRARPVERRTL